MFRREARLGNTAKIVNDGVQNPPFQGMNECRARDDRGRASIQPAGRLR